jgi:adenylate kinase
MRVILLGPPGSGKGTQAKLLCERLAMTHISTGDILRESVRMSTALGREAQRYMDSGRLVPDTLVNDIIAERFARPNRPTSFLMDGYPRTVNQAESLDGVLREHSLSLDAVLVLEVPDDEIIRRISGRRICPKDQTPYHILCQPPKAPDVCDLCGTTLIQRSDDQEETVRNRLSQYHATVDGVITFYRQRQGLQTVNGVGPIQEVFAACLEKLRETVPC